MNDENLTQQPNTGSAGDEKFSAEVTETNFDTVIGRVLEAGSVANQTASLAAESTEHLIAAAGRLQKASELARLHSVIVLAVTGVLMLCAVGVFFLMARQLHESLEAADAAVLAVGKRILQLNSGVQYLKDIQSTVENLEQRLESQSSSVEKIAARVDGTLAELRKVNTDLAEKLAKPADPKAANAVQAQLQSQSQAINQMQSALAQLKSSESGLREVVTQMQNQSKSMQKLGEQVTALQKSTARIGAIAQNVDTIIALQKQRAAVATPAPSATAPAAAAQPAVPARKERAEVVPGAIRYPSTTAPDGAKPSPSGVIMVAPPKPETPH